MRFQSTLLALSALTLATATPVKPLHPTGPITFPHHHEVLTTREMAGEYGKIGAMYMCTDTDFTGTCDYVKPDMGTCYRLSPRFEDNVRSFGPDQFATLQMFAFVCRLYDGETCTGSNRKYEWPGVGDGKLGDSMKSARCEFKDPKAMEKYKLFGLAG
jgi:hypothetical protein